MQDSAPSARQQEEGTLKEDDVENANRPSCTERHRLDQAGIIVLDVSDPGTHRPAGHLPGWIWREQTL
jgi:hypothetical protein